MILLERNLLPSEDLKKIENKMSEIIDKRCKNLEEKFGKEMMQLIILKKLEKYIKLK